jgi:uncharacterized protein YaaQ
LRDGIIAEETYSHLVGEVDTALADPQSNLVELLLQRSSKPIRGMMTIIVQETDVENVIAAMNRLGIPVTRLTSQGGFLERRNVTILAGIPKGHEERVTRAIQNSSRQRVEFLPAPGEDQRDATSVTVGGATIFTLDVEQYEEL